MVCGEERVLPGEPGLRTSISSGSHWRLEARRKISHSPKSSLSYFLFFFALWLPFFPEIRNTFQTKQVVFTRRNAAQTTSKRIPSAA